MFVVDYRREVGVGRVRKLRLFRTLENARAFAQAIPDGWGHEVREAARDDIFEMAQDMLAVASAACAAKDMADAQLHIAKAVALLEAMEGAELPEGYEILLYREEERDV